MARPPRSVFSTFSPIFTCFSLSFSSLPSFLAISPLFLSFVFRFFFSSSENSSSSSSLHCISLSLFLLISSQYLLLCVPLNTIGEEVFATTFVHLLSSIVSPRALNASLAYYDVVESLCRLVGPVLLGRLTAQLGSTGCLWLLSGCWVRLREPSDV